jgi:hypothetical protein
MGFFPISMRHQRSGLPVPNPTSRGNFECFFLPGLFESADLSAGYDIRHWPGRKKGAYRQFGDAAEQIVLGNMDEVAGFAFVFWTASTSCFTLQLNFRECYAPGNHSVKAESRIPILERNRFFP